MKRAIIDLTIDQSEKLKQEKIKEIGRLSRLVEEKQVQEKEFEDLKITVAQLASLATRQERKFEISTYMHGFQIFSEM